MTKSGSILNIGTSGMKPPNAATRPKSHYHQVNPIALTVIAPGDMPSGSLAGQTNIMKTTYSATWAGQGMFPFAI